MPFESLTDKFQSIFRKMRGNSILTSENMEEALREIRLALLEADVNYKVVKAFTEDVKEKAEGQALIKSVNPSQMLIKICHDELVTLLGADSTPIVYAKSGVTTLMLVGLQGAGKTTTAGKLAYLEKNKLGKKPLLAALDVYRPAAIDQLHQIGKEIGVDVFDLGTKVSPLEVAEKAKAKAVAESYDVLILDTAGRLQVDEPLMKELQGIDKAIHPEETLLLVDAMAGQDAVNVALSFNSYLRLSGVIMSKFDGDAKGGAALSIKYMTGLPIKAIGIGEKLSDFDIFHPDRLADRILGMGDVVTLVEKAKEVMNEKDAEKESQKMLQGRYTLDDMMKQMKMVEKMGSLGSLAKLIPGMPNLTDEQKTKADQEMHSFEAIVNSMTPYERAHPEILKFSQKNRIAKGSGKTNADINRVIRKWEKSKEMMAAMSRYKKTGKMPPGFGGFKH